ncbi:Ktr system potassium uptake protein A [compost metagenome]
MPACMDGKSLSELNTRAKYGCSIIALNREDGVIVAPTAHDHVHQGDIMVVIGSNESIVEFEDEAVNVE